ncbi:cation:proton antiporter [Streptomyces sp. AP-93]|uniref:cation:proton antiporter domain-containing protein n=1 Tax=Streptomyces sp. AP-93 TaxID=2929048 RepID=UPI001FB0370F|nr:cation:proton antiporter [Streptomyces sp. AP-93]MCJ0867799.1 cation:proton antiporter [Streptomyces sp. AP-93]
MADVSARSADLIIAITMADIAIILVAGSILGRLVRYVRQPPVVGEIIAGIALGPSLLGLLPGDLPSRIFPSEVRPYLSAIAHLGLLVFMFGIGWEFDKRLLQGRHGTTAAVSIASVVVPFVLAVGLAALLYDRHDSVNGKHISFTAFALFMGAAMSITAFPVLARILTEHGMMGTRVGALALASAAIDDVLAWCLLALVGAIVTASGGSGDFAQTVILAALYVTAMLLVVRPLLSFLVRRWVRDRMPPQFIVVLVAGLFLSSYATTLIGVHAIFGAFAFGFVMPRESRGVLSEGVKRPFGGISLVLLPVFFIVTGLNVDIGALSGRDLLELVAIIIVASAGKLLGASIPGRLAGLPWREAGTLGILMNTRGLTELIILNAGVSLGVLDSRMFTMMVVMALFTTALTGPFLPKAQAPADQAGPRARPEELAAATPAA